MKAMSEDGGSQAAGEKHRDPSGHRRENAEREHFRRVQFRRITGEHGAREPPMHAAEKRENQRGVDDHPLYHGKAERGRRRQRDTDAGEQRDRAGNAQDHGRSR
jgi:hypothetical protein